MAEQKTIYRNQDAFRLVVESEDGEEVIWIADDLDEMQVCLTRKELRDLLPALLGWLEGDAAAKCESVGKGESR